MSPIDPRPGWVRQRTYELHQSGLSWLAAREQAEPRLMPFSPRRSATHGPTR
jgi:hypothetical protein